MQLVQGTPTTTDAARDLRLRVRARPLRLRSRSICALPPTSRGPASTATSPRVHRIRDSRDADDRDVGDIPRLTGRIPPRNACDWPLNADTGGRGGRDAGNIGEDRRQLQSCSTSAGDQSAGWAPASCARSSHEMPCASTSMPNSATKTSSRALSRPVAAGQPLASLPPDRLGVQ